MSEPITLQLTITLVGEPDAALAMAAEIDAVIERSGEVTARHADGSPKAVQARIDGRPLAIRTKNDYR